MVCIIDDREDVWNFASNLIHVKPYQFFKGVGDINAPPGASTPPEEGNAFSGNDNTVEHMLEGDAKNDELNSEAQVEDDTVFKESSKSEEIKSQKMIEVKQSFENSGDNVEAIVQEEQPVVDTTVVGSNTVTKDITEKGETNEDSFKVVENGGSENAEDESKIEEPIDTKALSEDSSKSEENKAGKVEGVQERDPSDSDNKMAGEEPQLRCEGGECTR